MLLKTTRFVSLFCAALALGLTLAHDLEIPGKQQLSGADWLVVQHTFYGGFAILGGLAQIVGLISTGYLVFLRRQRGTAFVLTLIATLSFAGMLALFAFGNNPLNQQIATWTPQSLPDNWHQIRDAWDRFHATSSAFAALAFTVLLIALLRETPSSLSSQETSSERARESLAR
jgi:ribose/xylose/arabinose/galactoside ABC-type transport system permease subunit